MATILDNESLMEILEPFLEMFSSPCFRSGHAVIVSYKLKYKGWDFNSSLSWPLAVM